MVRLVCRYLPGCYSRKEKFSCHEVNKVCLSLLVVARKKKLLMFGEGAHEGSSINSVVSPSVKPLKCAGVVQLFFRMVFFSNQPRQTESISHRTFSGLKKEGFCFAVTKSEIRLRQPFLLALKSKQRAQFLGCPNEDR